MENLIYLLPLLGCVAMMLIMMKMMGGHKGHGEGSHTTSPDHQAEIAALHAEVDQLKHERDAP